MRAPVREASSNRKPVWPLRIRLTKRVGKPALLTCTRADGSATMAELPFSPVHDLIHYTVERTLDVQLGFYGLLASGLDVQDFDRPAARQALALPPEASEVEFIVGLLQTELLNGEAYDDFVAVLDAALESHGDRRCLWLDDALVQSVREQVAELWKRWSELEAGGSLELTMP